MTDDWMRRATRSPPRDPAAREREQRRLEREEKRRKREEKQAEKKGVARRRPGGWLAVATAGRLRRAIPRASARTACRRAAVPATPEEEFWDEEPLRAEEPFAGEAGVRGAAGVCAARPGAARVLRGGGSGGGGSGILGAVGRHPFRLVGAIVAVLVLWFLFALFQPFHGDGSGRVRVTIPKGASVSEVGDLLGEKGVIDSSTLFQVRVTLDGKRSELYPGHFTLAHGMSYGAAIDALSKPPVKRVTTVTIPEGYSRSQAAQLVEEDGLEGDYTKETVRSKYLNPAKYGGKGAKDLEGFLFPDTFEMKPGAPVADLVQLQLQDFKRRIKGVDMSYAKSKNLTVFDVLTIASMIEREAGVPKPAQAGRLGDLQPPARRDAAGDRRDDPLRHRQLRTSR